MPNSGPVEEHASLFTSLRSFWRVLIAILYTRLDLATTELGEEAFRIMSLAAAGIVGLLCLHGAFFFFMLWILAAFWDTQYRPWVIGGICLVYLLGAVILLLTARSIIVHRPRFLGQTLAELKRDVEGLQTAIKPAEPRP